jgi:hypothetical protein
MFQSDNIVEILLNPASFPRFEIFTIKALGMALSVSGGNDLDAPAREHNHNVLEIRPGIPRHFLMRQSAWHQKRFPCQEPLLFPWKTEIGQSADLDEKFGEKMKMRSGDAPHISQRPGNVKPETALLETSQLVFQSFTVKPDGIAV